jgi:hypothetical protein
MANPWDNDPIIEGGPTAGPVYGAPPKPDEPKTTWRTLAPEEAAAQGLPPGRSYQVSSEGKIDALPEVKEAPDPTNASLKLAQVIDKIDQVAGDSNDNKGWGETGFTGSVMRTVPGTAGYDLAANVQTIDAIAAFEALAEMRRNSPTGGALGQVTEKELDLLKSSIANLDTAQSQEQFLKNLSEARGIYLEMFRKIDPEAAAIYEKGGDDDPLSEAGREAMGLTGSVTDTSPPTGGGDSPPSGDRYSLDNIAQALWAGTGDVVQGVGDIAGIVGNPLNATINAVAGTNLSTDLGETLRSDVFGIPHGNRTVETINRGGVGALTGSLAARGASIAVNPGVTRNALRTFGATPGRDMIAGAGAGAGGEVGREIGGVPGQVIGTLGGGFAGYGAGNALLRAGQPRSPTPMAQAAERLGVDMLPADAGGTIPKMVTTGAKASPLSASPIRAAAQRGQDQLSSAATRAADSQGTRVTTDIAGENVRGAAERFTKQTAERGSRLYERASERAKGVKIKPVKTIAMLDEQIARLKENPADNGSAIGELERLRENIAGGVTVQGLRDARTQLSEGVFNGQLRSNSEKGRWKQVLGSVAEDIDAGLRSVGRDDAANMFRTADKFWSERVEHIDKVLQPILGNDRGGESVLQTIETMARGGAGGSVRLSRLLNNMTKEEAGNVRAAIIDRIGKATPGAQTAEGTAFSPATFLTNWNKLTPQAKSALFSDKGLRQNLDDIAMLSEGMKASQAMANHSNTGMAIGSNVGGGIVLAAAHPVLAVIGAGSQFVTGKLMASPGFARMLARTAKMPPEAAKRSMRDQLGVLATREPLIAADARALQQHLQQAFGQSPMRAAAGEEEQD